MTYKLLPPFEIYHDGTQIADKDGHICSAENPEIAKAILVALESNCSRASWCAPVVDDAAPMPSSENTQNIEQEGQ